MEQLKKRVEKSEAGPREDGKEHKSRKPKKMLRQSPVVAGDQKTRFLSDLL